MTFLRQYERLRNIPLSPDTKRAVTSSLLNMEMSGLPVDEYLQEMTVQSQKWLHWWADRYYSWQVSRNILSHNPLLGLQRPSYYLPLQYPDVPAGVEVKKRLRRLDLTDEQVLLIRLLLETGMKKKEIGLLSFDCIDYANRTITVSGLKRRIISISKELASLIKQSHEALPRPYVFSGNNHLTGLLTPVLTWAGLKVKGNAFNLFRQVFLLDSEAEHGLTRTMELTGYSQMNNIKSRVQALKSPYIKELEKALAKCLRIHRGEEI